MPRHVAIALLTALVALPSLAAANPIVVFSGKDANAPDEFAFVALQNISTNTKIYFTNYDWNNATGAFTNATLEGVLEFTATATITKGTVVQVAETANNVFTVTGASGTAILVSGSNDWSAVSADPHYAFNASNPAAPLVTVTEIYAYMDTDPDSALGGSKDPRIGTNSSPNAIVLDFVGVQPVGDDFIGNRAVAGVANLTKPVYFTVGVGSDNLTLDLTSFAGIVANAIFADGFEIGDTAGWSASVP